jgi:hypothetical protein
MGCAEELCDLYCSPVGCAEELCDLYCSPVGCADELYDLYCSPVGCADGLRDLYCSPVGCADELCDLYCSPNIILAIKSRECGTRGGRGFWWEVSRTVITVVIGVDRRILLKVNLMKQDGTE